MKKMQKAGIVMLSVVVLGGVAPAVAPSVLNLNGGVVHAAEETHKVTIHYDLYDDPMFLLRSSSSSKVVDVTPNQPLSEHIPETLPGGYVFADAIANGGGSEGGVSLSSRNDLFGNETAFYVHYLPKNTNSGNNNSNAEENTVGVYYHFEGEKATGGKVNIAENPNATVGDYYPLSKDGADLEYITDSKTMFWVYKISADGTYKVDNRGKLLSKYANSNLLGVYTKPKNANANAGANNNAGTEVKPNNDGKTTVASTPKTSSQSTPNQRDGWSGLSYYQNGTKVTSQWIFDKNYNSYFYLDASGNYVQNAWVGNYYLKSGGYMAKSEWIYDSNYKSYYYLTSEGSYARNAWAGSYYLKSDGKMAKSEWIYDSSYQSYYYLTSEGSYARNTWVGDYYLKSNGKMAVNERTPDGYQVDASGKWVR